MPILRLIMGPLKEYSYKFEANWCIGFFLGIHETKYGWFLSGFMETGFF